MSNLIVILNVLVVLGMVISAILAIHFENLLSSVIALCIRQQATRIHHA